MATIAFASLGVVAEPIEASAATEEGSCTISVTDAVDVLHIANAERAHSGRAALEEDPALDAIATAHAQDMAVRNYFSHVTPEGLDPFQRMDAAKYHYDYAGENIAEDDTVKDAATALWNSAPHRANTLSGDFKHVGVGVVVSADGDIYVVEDFSS